MSPRKSGAPLLNVYMALMVALMAVTLYRRHRAELLLGAARLCQLTAGGIGAAGIRFEAALRAGVTA